MFRIWCRTKISNATITGLELDYEGSITLPPELMEAADIKAGEKVQVVNLNNGERLETYVIEGAPETGEILLNGPAARKGMPGDKIMVLSYAIGETSEVGPPKVVFVDDNNRLVERG
ncbi:aspartate 1-decarboxylase [bacterium]|nr:MAG: aspartate 1-decarboxylase [bacterium]